ncbi:MAG TPA: AraC family transcriptional regulator [Pyrinomonadaceae bacterium]|nr:AraC family transcriptional regulator [Pyrinomonadaceae bacterium]
MGFLTRTGALYLGPDMKTSTHALHNFKIYIAVRGEFDLFLASGGRFRSCRAAVIAPDRAHRIVSRDVIFAAFYLVPETPEGRKVSAYYDAREVFAPPRHVLAALLPRLRGCLERGCDREEADYLCDLLFKNLTPPGDAVRPLDRRVAGAIEYLDSAIGRRRLTIAEIASEVALSPSRFSHLFNEQVGIPVSRYVLWARTRAALNLMTSGRSLTEVALEAGFSDSAHLSRTFRSMIGIAPSTLLRTTHLYRSAVDEK